MKNNKKNITLLKYICVSYFTVVLFIPFCIYVVYRIFGVSIHFLTSSPANVARYFGTTIGGLATLVAIFITISRDEKRREEERKHQEEEKKHDARVFIVMEPNIRFSYFNEFCKYARNVDISKLYYFREDLLGEVKKMSSITRPDNEDSPQSYRFASFIVENPANLPIYNISINAYVSIVPTGIENFHKDIGTFRIYKPINITVLPQQRKFAFALPVLKKERCSARSIKITYWTQMKEQMCYKYSNSGDTGFATEKYYASDEELFCSDKNLSPFYDLKKWDG